MTKRMTSLSLWGLALVIVVSLAAVAARTTWHLSGKTSERVATDLGADPYSASRPATDLSPIFSLQPFGTINAPPPSRPEAEETDLGLTLHGIVLAQPANASIALIASTNQDVNAYSVDDPVPGGALLQEILPNKVILRVDGRRETLSFPKEVTPSSGVARLRGLVPDSVAGRSTAPVDNSAPAVIERYRQRIAANPKTVLDNLGVSVTEQGYQIGQQPAAGVRRAGLRSGDIVARVNGEDVGNVEKDRRLFDKIAASGRARIEVLRDGQRIIMSFPLK